MDANAHVLGTALVPETIASNTANAVRLSLNGTIASLQLFLSNSSFSVGTPATALVVVVPLDSSGAQIVNPGAYSPSIAVASVAPAHHFSLIFDGTPSGSAATLLSPSDQVVLSYDGVATDTAHVTVTAGAATASRNASAGGPPALSSGISGTVSSTAQHFQFTSLGQTGTITPAGGAAPYTVTAVTPGVVSIAPGSGAGPFTVTATGFGSTTITITDSASASTTQLAVVVPPPLTITDAQGVSINGGFAAVLGGTGATQTFTIGGGCGTGSYTGGAGGTGVTPGIAGHTLTLFDNGSQTGNTLMAVTDNNAGFTCTDEIEFSIGVYALTGTDAFYAGLDGNGVNQLSFLNTGQISTFSVAGTSNSGITLQSGNANVALVSNDGSTFSAGPVTATSGPTFWVKSVSAGVTNVTMTDPTGTSLPIGVTVTTIAVPVQ
jgi:hypothetical protein